MVDIIDIINVGLFAATLRMATPLVYASLGGLFSERVGVINIGLEGMMLTGAFSGVLATYGTGNAWVGVLTSTLVGGLLGLLHALLTVKFAGNQIVSGTGINIFALGFTAYMSQIVWGSRGASPNIQGLGPVPIPLLKDLPVVGAIIGNQSPLVYIALVVVMISYIVLSKTSFGLRIKAVGKYPAAADTAGINVHRTKYIGVIVGGMLAGLGGAFLSLDHLSFFASGMSGGRGFIALAAMILGGWKPIGVLGASLLFGFTDALSLRLQSLGMLPSQIIFTVPYIVTIIVLAGFVRKRVPPSDYKPYIKD